MMRLLHLAAGTPTAAVLNAMFQARLRELVDVNIVSNGRDLAPAEQLRLFRDHDVALVGWGALPLPMELARDPGRLKYICGYSGTMRAVVPIELVQAGIPLTNWGDAPAHGIAEAAMMLLLAVMKDVHHRVQHIRGGGWKIDQAGHGGTLQNAVVGVYGCGAIGRRFVEMLRPFGATIRVFDRYVTEIPEGCERVETLESLFDGAHAIVIHAALTPETTHSVTADLLRRLPDHAIVVNTARGGIVDQAALFAELESGRLRAGLDVLEPDSLPPEHPARRWENVILTAHSLGMGWPGRDGAVSLAQSYAVDNLRRFIAGEPLRFVLDETRYLRST